MPQGPTSQEQPTPARNPRPSPSASRTAPLAPALALALAAALLLAACGYKSWPRPAAKEDRFEWGSVDVLRKGNCLDVAGKLKGAGKNLDRVLLQLQSEDSGCAGCPFDPDIVLDFGPGSQDFQMEGNDLRFTTCALAPGKAYRMRLAGVNRFTALGLTLSKVLNVLP